MRSLLVLVLLLGGCSGTIVEVPVSNVRNFRPIQASCRDTAETRQQINRHNSVLDSLKTGREVTYRDDCPKPAAKEQPKTS